jgi:hypothetical protein
MEGENLRIPRRPPLRRPEIFLRDRRLTPIVRGENRRGLFAIRRLRGSFVFPPRPNGTASMSVSDHFRVFFRGPVLLLHKIPYTIEKRLS